MATSDSDGTSPRSDDDATVDSSDAAVATTAARALVLGAALTGSDALLGLRGDLDDIGVGRLPTYWAGGEERAAIVEASDRVLARYDVLDQVRAAEAADGFQRGTRGDAPERAARPDLWREVAKPGRQM